jgi:hypothetical protein
LCAAGAAVALILARRDPRHYPIGAYLAAVCGLDLLRLGRAALLPATMAPRLGWELLARHFDCGAYLATILALPAMALPLFLRRSPLPVVAAGAAGWLLLIAAYPEVRGQQLMELYGAVELAGVVFAVGCMIMWLRSERLLEDGPSVPIMAGLALIAGSAGACIVPRLTGATLLEAWPVVVAVNALVLTFVLVSQLRLLWEEARE